MLQKWGHTTDCNNLVYILLFSSRFSSSNGCSTRSWAIFRSRASLATKSPNTSVPLSWVGTEMYIDFVKKKNILGMTWSYIYTIIILTIFLLLQGVSYWRVQSKSALRCRRINNFIVLWCRAAYWDLYICENTTRFYEMYFTLHPSFQWIFLGFV